MPLNPVLSPKKTNRVNTHQLSPSPSPSRSLFSNALMQENIETAEIIISKWNPIRSPQDSLKPQFTSLFQGNKQEAHEFLECVHGLRKAMHFLISRHPDSNKLVLANEFMGIAMSRLEKEFHHILSLNRNDYSNPEWDSGGSSRLPLSPQSSEDEDSFASFEEVGIQKVVPELKMIAHTMISSGYSKECVVTYNMVRKSIIDEQFSNLGLGSLPTTRLINRMDSEAIESHVRKWKQIANFAIRRLFRAERLMCDHVFAFYETFKQTCIAHVIMERAVHLFQFPENLAKSKPSADKIFPAINLYEAVSDLWPDIESIFSYHQVSSVKIQALSIIHNLSDSIQTMLSLFVSTIQRNSSKKQVPGGGIHPLTISVMNFVSLLAERSTVLSDIFTEAPPFAFPIEFESLSPTSAVGSQFRWIILVLLCKLDGKSEAYNEVALSYLFLANNFQFVVDEINASTSLKFLLGETWVSKLETKLRIYASNYEAVGWAKVFSCLTVEEPPPDAIEERIKRFSSAFEETYVKQSSWVVPNPKLRDEIKASVTRKMVPTYRRLASAAEGKKLEVVLRLSPDNLENYLSELFNSKTVVSFSGRSTPRSVTFRCV